MLLKANVNQVLMMALNIFIAVEHKVIRNNNIKPPHLNSTTFPNCSPSISTTHSLLPHKFIPMSCGLDLKNGTGNIINSVEDPDSDQWVEIPAGTIGYEVMKYAEKYAQ